MWLICIHIRVLHFNTLHDRLYDFCWSRNFLYLKIHENKALIGLLKAAPSVRNEFSLYCTVCVTLLLLAFLFHAVEGRMGWKRVIKLYDFIFSLDCKKSSALNCCLDIYYSEYWELMGGFNSSSESSICKAQHEREK